MSPHGSGSALGSCEVLGAVVVDVVAWAIHPLLMLLLLLLGLYNLSPAWHWDQAVQGHLLAVHVHLVDDWEAVEEKLLVRMNQNAKMVGEGESTNENAG